MVKLKNESNMKTIFKTIACLSAALLAYSCVLDEIDTQITDEQAIAQIRLECDALESYTIQSQKLQAVSFRVSSTTPWEITGFEESDWLTVEPASSKVSSLSEDITVKATKFNNTLADRSVTLTVKGANTSITHSINITQMRMGQLTVEEIEGDFDKAGATKTFTVSSNISWEATAADSWLTLNPSSGTSDGPVKTFTVSAEAAANKSLSRTTVVTVISGDEKKQFFVKQDGHTLEFKPLESPVIDRRGGDLIFDVTATLDWKVETDNESFTATKLSDTQVKVHATFNNQFVERKANIILKPASDEYGDVSGSVEVSQGVNFTLQNCELLEDGSVKMSGSKGSKVVTIDSYRSNFDITLTMGEKHFGTAGQLWVEGKIGGVNIYNQLSLGGNTRIRTDGTMAGFAEGDDAGSSYKSSKYDITQDELNAMETYHYMFATNATDETKMDMKFEVDGKEKKSHTGPNPFYYDEGSCTFSFGFHSTTTDGSWYVVKTCDIK